MSAGARRVVSILGLALAFLLLGGAAPAAAHTNLDSSSPKDGASVHDLDRIVLRFAGRVETSGVHVWLENGDGDLYPLGPVTHANGDVRTLEVTVPPIESGDYRIGYHAVAFDGDAIEGVVRFVLDRPPTATDVEADAQPLGPPLLARSAPSSAATVSHHPGQLSAGTARVVLDSALATLIGGIAFVVTVWPQGTKVRATRRVLWGALVVAVVASSALAVVQHAAASELGIVASLAPRQLGRLLDYEFGRVAVARTILLAAAAGLTVRLDRAGADGALTGPWSSAAGAIAIGLFETVVLLGHRGEPGAVTTAARFAHVLGVSVWLGGLVMLVAVVVPRRRPEELGEVLRRFSRLATVTVTLLVVAGVVLGLGLAGIRAIEPTTAYGRVLVLKVSVVAVLLIVASRSRRRVRLHVLGLDQDGAAIAVTPLLALVGVELGLVAIVLALTAVLLAQAPPQ